MRCQKEIDLYAGREGFGGRQFEFVYFGGGTPSYLSNAQLHRLVDRINENWTWDAANEVTFECEPGTLKESKLQTIKKIGVTRLSLGVEHFDDEILSINGRAHKSPEIGRAYNWAREVGFAQINIDLIAGMLGETEDKWKYAVEKALELDADSLHHLPDGSAVQHEDRQGRPRARRPNREVASWAKSGAWVDYAFRQFEAAGYVVSSGYTLVKPEPACRVRLSRFALARGRPGRHRRRVVRALPGRSLSERRHLGAVHQQAGRRAASDQSRLPVTDHQLLIREMILQLKTGQIDAGYFRQKFGEEILTVFRDAYASLVGRRIRHHRRRPRPHDPAGPAAGRLAAAAVLRAAVPEHSIYVKRANEPITTASKVVWTLKCLPARSS